MAEGLIIGFYVFVLAMFVGFEVITKVPQMLHTPLMSGSNAISGITIVGAVLIAGRLESPFSIILGVAALIFATVNVVGGFLVTDRMLQMFRREPPGGGRKAVAAAPDPTVQPSPASSAKPDGERP